MDNRPMKIIGNLVQPFKNINWLGFFFLRFYSLTHDTINTSLTITAKL